MAARGEDSGHGPASASRRSRVTIQTVADAAGVSKKTVSRVLNQESGVNPATRDRVLEAVKNLGFKPNVAARSLAGARSYSLALLYDDPTSDYMAGIQGGVLDICRQHSYHLMLEPLDLTAPDALAPLRRLDGAILMPPLSDSDALVDNLIAERIPVALISSASKRRDVIHISIDDKSAAERMTRHLIELGHERIGFLIGRSNHASTAARHEGFLAAMAEAGLDVPDEAVATGDFTFASGMAAAQTLLDTGFGPTAIFASNDHMAAGVMAALHQRGLHVPDDVSVAGFDAAPIAEMVWPPLTTMHQPFTGLGREAADRLITFIQSGRDGEATACLTCELLARDSTAPPARRPSN